jgi:hypothetical protein
MAKSGGEGGIRTRGTVTRTTVFELEGSHAGAADGFYSASFANSAVTMRSLAFAQPSSSEGNAVTVSEMTIFYSDYDAVE